MGSSRRARRRRRQARYGKPAYPPGPRRGMRAGRVILDEAAGVDLADAETARRARAAIAAGERVWTWEQVKEDEREGRGAS